MTRSSSVVIAVLASTLFVVGAASGCYGATEIRVELTTTAPCTNGMETQLFTGARGTTDFGTASAAGTQACASDLGTLSIVPSGSREARSEAESLRIGPPTDEREPATTLFDGRSDGTLQRYHAVQSTPHAKRRDGRACRPSSWRTATSAR
jgi:hypothetical protein